MKILYEVFSMLWVHEIQPAAWQLSLMQPIYNGGDKSQADPASYRGIYLSSALAKLFEGILISRLTKITETHSMLTENQLRTRSGRQIHDAIYCLLSIIQYNISQKGLATYVAFCDFSTAFPSIHRGKLLSLLCKENIVGILWGGYGSTSENDFTQSKSVSSTHGSPKVAVSSSCEEC